MFWLVYYADILFECRAEPVFRSVHVGDLGFLLPRGRTGSMLCGLDRLLLTLHGTYRRSLSRDESL